MPENSKSSSSSLLWFFRGLFGVKVLATWSPLVLEAMGDLKVGWVGSRFFCLAYKFSDSGVVSVEGGCDSSLGVEGVVGERSRGEVRRVLDDESLVSEKKATNCRPNWSERLYGCLHLILTWFHFLVAAALDSFSLPYVTDLVLFFPLLESGTVIRVDWGRRVMYSSESKLAESPTNTSTNADPKLPGERRSSLSGDTCHTKFTWPGYEAITDLPSAMLAILVLLESSSTTSALLDLLSVAHSHFRPAHDSKLLAGFWGS